MPLALCLLLSAFILLHCGKEQFACLGEFFVPDRRLRPLLVLLSFSKEAFSKLYRPLFFCRSFRGNHTNPYLLGLFF